MIGPFFPGLSIPMAIGSLLSSVVNLVISYCSSLGGLHNADIPEMLGVNTRMVRRDQAQTEGGFRKGLSSCAAYSLSR